MLYYPTLKFSFNIECAEFTIINKNENIYFKKEKMALMDQIILYLFLFFLLAIH